MKERGIGAVAIVAIVVVIAAVGVGGYILLKGEAEYETYVNENLSFKFDYPADWAFEEWITPFFASFMVTEKSPENEVGGVIALVIYDKAFLENQFGVSLDNLASYISRFENNIENIENYVLISKPTEIAIDNLSGVRFSETRTIENIAIRFQLELVVKDNYLYEFMVGTAEEKYSIYEPIFEHVINSFSFLWN